MPESDPEETPVRMLAERYGKHTQTDDDGPHGDDLSRNGTFWWQPVMAVLEHFAHRMLYTTPLYARYPIVRCTQLHRDVGFRASGTAGNYRLGVSTCVQSASGRGDTLCVCD